MIKTVRAYARKLCYWGLFIGIGSLLAVLLLFHAPQVVGAEGSYVVLSDSMEPTFSSGALIIVQSMSPAAIDRGDVITYRDSNGAGRTTHRVAEVVTRDGTRYFRTKGDANENIDPDPVAGSQVIGQVWVSIPAVGYLLVFLQRPSGFGLIVLLPAVGLVLLELRDRSRAPTGEDG